MKKNIEFYVIYFKFSKINFSFMCALWMEICMMKLNTYSPILLKKIYKILLCVSEKSQRTTH